jgi:hypothetical protein
VGPADGSFLEGLADGPLLVGPADVPLLVGLDYYLLKVVLADGPLLVGPSDGPSTSWSHLPLHKYDLSFVLKHICILPSIIV